MGEALRGAALSAFGRYGCGCGFLQMIGGLRLNESQQPLIVLGRAQELEGDTALTD